MNIESQKEKKQRDDESYIRRRDHLLTMMRRTNWDENEVKSKYRFAKIKNKNEVRKKPE